MKTPIPFESIQSGSAFGSMLLLMRARNDFAAGALSLFMESNKRKFDFSMGLSFKCELRDLHRNLADNPTPD